MILFKYINEILWNEFRELLSFCCFIGVRPTIIYKTKDGRK